MIRAKLTIDLSTIIHNIEIIRQKYTGRIYAVLKANAYGLGVTKIAESIEKTIDGICVSTIEEGIELRESGIKKDILILGPILHEEYYLAKKYHLCISVVSDTDCKKTLTISDEDIPYIYVALDTGMNRYGLRGECVSLDRFIEKASEKILGFYTHYYEGGDRKTAEEQNKLFDKYFHSIKTKKILKNSKFSACNSDAVFSGNDSYSFCRVGLGLYGFCENGTKIAIRFVSYVCQVHCCKAGERVGYGGTYVMPHDGTIAVVSCGYADGYPRELSNKGTVIVKGRSVPIAGAVCMDCFMIDVTGVTNVNVGDEVLLFGEENRALLSANDVFPYSFLTGIGSRVEREYLF